MGQRHQIYVVTPNAGYFNSPKDSNDYKNHVSKYGDKENVIFPYHNQWLYGRTALSNCLNLLVTYKKIGFKNTFHKYGNMFDYLADIFKRIQLLTLRDGFIANESITFEGDNFPKMRFSFDLGDNNDGITIVFPKEKKYCFMFINNDENYPDRIPYIPLSGLEYLKFYYPDCDSNEPLVKSISKYKVLTKDEIKKLFPRMKLNHLMG